MLKIIKIGGGIIDNPDELNSFLKTFSAIESPKILIHGGGKGASKMLQKLGIEPNMIEGRRVTDQATLDVVTGLYAGNINKMIVSILQQNGTNAVGLSGADGNVIKGIKRPIKTVDFGFVGDINLEGINIDFLQLLIDNGYTPVMCAITHDGNAQLLNTNADTIASTIAEALAQKNEVELNFCFDKIGVLRDVNDDSTLIPIINKELYQELKEKGIIFEGMIPKLDNSFRVIENGVKNVCLVHANNINTDIKTVLC
ncbi:acetylglutamate kinase [Faecalibacter rhinopitheci]|uniref:Acetylglutamate kinase n=1 Tax=Faecalibacter rhinopitheci TaxID=2779678 RepID=A0A8J7KB21_9FLAO|nr:acetylglutamate kinase [Faecalibacter rhinopitheci]MBF0598135.1 acetylglutamate kinase [Faecalibacter rhinopitheci]MBQ0148124.1 acetylglutamate kinase [Candidatus Onthonaster equi]